MRKQITIPVVVLSWLISATSLCVAQSLNVHPSKGLMPGTCETHSAILDATRNEALEGSGKDRIVIAIARLGDGETSRQLNRRRLYNLTIHWNDYGLPSGTLITAEGKRVTGFGRVELYVAGKLYELLVPKRGKDLCVACCDRDERLYPYRAVKRRRAV